MKKTLSFLIGGILIIIGLVIFLRDTSPAPQEPLVIGALYGVTGAAAHLGNQYKNGTELAIEEINTRGGVRGRNLALALEDHQWDPKVAVTAFKKLSEINGVKYFLSIGSGVGLSIKPLIEKKRVVAFLDAAHPQITKDSRFILRHSNIASIDAIQLANAAAKFNPKKMGILYLNDEWGVVWNDEFQKNIRKAFPKISILAEAHKQKETDFRSPITKLIEFRPDVMMVASYGAAPGFIIKQLKEMGYRGSIVANNGLVLSPEAQDIAGIENLKGIYYQTYAKTPEEFQLLYRQKFGADPGLFSLYAYTDVEIIAHAIEEVGNSPEKIVAFIKNLGKYKGQFETVAITPEGDIIIDTVVKQWE